MIENPTSTWNTAPAETPTGNRQREIAACPHGGGRGGPALFFSLLVHHVSFLPVFTLEARKAGCSRAGFTKTTHGGRRRPS